MATKPTNLLANLPNELTIKKVIRYSDYTEIQVAYHEYERVCPNCGSSACIIKDSGKDYRVYHAPSGNRPTHLCFHRRRFLCKDCHRSFMEQPAWLHPTLHLTQALYLNICLDLTDMLSVSAIANKNCVNDDVVNSALALIQMNPPSKLPETLCMDEFKGETGIWNPQKCRWDTEKYHASVIDGSSRAVIDVLPVIRSSELKKYFRQFSSEERARVRFFCCDMHNGFIGTAKEMFPNCTICIDPFHVVKHLNEDAVDAIRTRLQDAPGISPAERRILKGSMRLLRVKDSGSPANHGVSPANHGVFLFFTTFLGSSPVFRGVTLILP
jgi:transposase